MPRPGSCIGFAKGNRAGVSFVGTNARELRQSSSDADIVNKMTMMGEADTDESNVEVSKLVI